MTHISHPLPRGTRVLFCRIRDDGVPRNPKKGTVLGVIYSWRGYRVHEDTDNVWTQEYLP